MPTIEHKNEMVTFQTLAKELENDDVTEFRLENVVIEGEDVGMKFSKTLRGHPGIKSFSCVNVVSDEDLDQAVSMVFVTVLHLESVRLEATKVSAGTLATACYSASLKNFYIPNSGLTDAEAAVLAGALSQNNSMEHVDLSGNKLSDVGCKAFSKALQKNLTLKTLRLDGNAGISGSELRKVNAALSMRAATAA